MPYSVEHCVGCGSEKLAANAAVLAPFVAERALEEKSEIISDDWNLKCASAGTHLLTRWDSQTCTQCGTIQSKNRFTTKEALRLYRGYRGSEYNEQRIGYEPDYQRIAEKLEVSPAGYKNDLERYIELRLNKRPESLLDYGGGNGTNTAFSKTLCRICIYDISSAELGAKNISDARFEVVTLSGVLEHVSSPMEVLREVTENYCDNTLIIAEVPHEKIIKERDRGNRLLRRHWHEHITLFTPKGLYELFKRCGTTDIKVEEVGYGEDGMSELLRISGFKQ